MLASKVQKGSTAGENGDKLVGKWKATVGPLSGTEIDCERSDTINNGYMCTFNGYQVPVTWEADVFTWNYGSTTGTITVESDGVTPRMAWSTGSVWRKKVEYPYKCYQWSEKDLEQNHNGGWSIEKEKRTCEGYENFIFTQGDDSKAPGCGGCWCCQPKNKDSNELCEFVSQQSCTNDYVKTNCPYTCSGMNEDTPLPSGVVECGLSENQQDCSNCAGEGWYSHLTIDECVDAIQICLDQGYDGKIEEYGGNDGTQCEYSNNHAGKRPDLHCFGSTVSWNCGGYHMIAAKGGCEHVSGKHVYRCYQAKEKNSQKICEDSCSSHHTCVGYMYDTTHNAQCFLYPSDKSCPSGFSVWTSGRPRGRHYLAETTTASMNELTTSSYDIFVCYGKI